MAGTEARSTREKIFLVGRLSPAATDMFLFKKAVL